MPLKGLKQHASQTIKVVDGDFGIALIYYCIIIYLHLHILISEQIKLMYLMLISLVCGKKTIGAVSGSRVLYPNFLLDS